MAYLVLNANLAVSTDQLVDALWGGAAPNTARTQVQVLISRIRRLLRTVGAEEAVASHAAGYRLVVGDGDTVDAIEFTDLATRAAADTLDRRLSRAADRYAEALALWRGPALSGAAGAFVEAATARLEEQRLVVREELADVELTLGRHSALVGRLRELLDTHPLRERLVGQLMLALYRCGRRAEALAVFRQFSAVLRDEHGLEASAKLAELHHAILRADAAPQPAGRPADTPAPVPAPARARVAPPAALAPPAQLPGDVSGFTGRADYLDILNTLVPDGAGTSAGAVIIAAVTGCAGIGKTALAVHWAHRARHRFPDGQLYINLRGYSADAPLRPIDALARFLHALGVPPEQVPAEVDEAAAVYRGCLADRRMLILLDNANHADQVRPLLPGGSGCMVLITSRDQLGGLVARDGAQRIALELLPPVDSAALLTELLGADRVAAEPVEVVELARLCGHLPLALRIAAAQLVGRQGRRIGDLAAELSRGDRLAVLEVGDDEQAAVRAAFDLSYHALAEDARRLFRLLGLVPGGDVTAEVGAALTGASVAQARRLLDRLASAHLIDKHAEGRYAFHDLIRLYAGDRGHAEEPVERREAARLSLLRYYLHTSDAAARLLYPQFLRLPWEADGPVHPQSQLEDQTGALEWLDAERANLVAAVAAAAEHGPVELAWLLGDALRGYFFFRIHAPDWSAVATAALAAAEAGGNRRAEAAAQLSLGGLYWRRGHYRQALDRFVRSLAIAEEEGWDAGQGSALTTLGITYAELGQTRPALTHLTRALELERRTGRLGGQQVALINVGFAYLGLGKLDSAECHTREALAISLEIESRDGQANCLKNLGVLHHLRGRFDDATDHLTRALRLYEEVGNRGAQSTTMRSIAAVHRDSGRHREALEVALMAATLAHGIGSTRYEGMALNTLGTIHTHFGRHREAIDCHLKALDLAMRTGNRDSQLEALIGMAGALLETGQHAPALEHAEQALGLARTIGTRILEGDALVVLADARLRMGERGVAIRHAREALVIHRETGYRLGEARAQVVLVYALCETDADQAAMHWRQAQTLFTQLGAPALVDAGPVPAPRGRISRQLSRAGGSGGRLLVRPAIPAVAEEPCHAEDDQHDPHQDLQE